MFHVEILFYLTRLLMNNVTLQLWPCSLIFNIVQVSTFYLFSHLIHISSKGKSPAKLLLSTGCVSNNSERPSYILRSLIMPRNALGFETITCHCFPHIAAKKESRGRETNHPFMTILYKQRKGVVLLLYFVDELYFEF